MIPSGLSLFVFGIYLGVRGFAPDILGLEKFMDFGFIRSYMENSGFPTLDPWWAEEKINYYTFGHFLAGKFLWLTRIPPGIGYNVLLALIFGSSCGLVYLIVDKSNLKPYNQYDIFIYKAHQDYLVGSPKRLKDL